MWQMKTEVTTVVVGALGTVKKGMVENIKKSDRATVTETQKICMLGSARILRKVLTLWTERLTWVTDARGAWFAPGWCTKTIPAKTVTEETMIIIKVNYDYHKKSPKILGGNFFKKLYNFDNFVRRRPSGHNKITFAIKYLPTSHLR